MSSLKFSSRSDRPSIRNYSDWEEIGKGGFGVVYKARNKIGETVAIKKLPRNRVGVRVEDEIRVLQKLNSGVGHNRIVRFYESFSDENFAYIVMEYCELGTLRQYIKKNRALENRIAADVLSQLVEGVGLMHKNGVMHRDLTASNILISRITNGRLFVKIADFGLTKKAPPKAVVGTCLGTPGYMAPQIRNREEYGRQADVYSLGAILFAMLMGKDPPELTWNEDGCPLFSNGITSKMDAKALDMLERMLCKTEDGRITLEEMEDHPFIQLAHASRLTDMKLKAPQVKAGVHRRVLPDSGRGTGSGSNNARSLSRCRHINVAANRKCNDCGFIVGSRRNTNVDTVAPVSKVPMISSPKIPVASECCSQAPRNSRSSNGVVAANSVKRLIWPIPDVRHLAYMSTNTFGRFAIRSEVRPAMVYEMPDDNGEVKLIFELYDNIVQNGQRLLVFLPLERVPIPVKSDEYLKKDFASGIRLRSADDLRRASPDIRLGYKRLLQFITLAETRVTQAAFRNTFGFPGFNLELRFSGTIELTLPDGRRATQAPDGKMNWDTLDRVERKIFTNGCVKLRQSVDMGQLNPGNDGGQFEQFLRRPCVTNWAKMKPDELSKIGWKN